MKTITNHHTTRQRLTAAIAATCLLCVSLMLSACRHVEDEPELNTGYETNYLVPDPEPMTAEDSAVVAAQQAEYGINAK